LAAKSAILGQLEQIGNNAAIVSKTERILKKSPATAAQALIVVQ
jgi:hypothetical protein